MDDKSELIDRQSPIPYYHQVSNIIRKMIKNGEFKKGEHMIPERELCEIFNVSRTVIRQALSELSEEGLIIKMKGRPSKVSKSKFIENANRRYYGFYQEITKFYNSKIVTKVLDKTITKPPSKVQRHFGYHTTDILKLTRLRLVDDEEAVLTKAYFPPNITKMIKNLDFEDVSLYEVLNLNFSLEPSAINSRIQSIVADNNLANILNISVGDPLFYLENIAYLQDGKILDYSETWQRGDRFCFQILSKANIKTEVESHYNKC